MTRTKKFTGREKTEQFALIELVKGHPELWDYKHQGYNNNVVLLNAWDKIGKIFGYSHKDMRLKWKSLRDTHRKHYMAEVKTGKTCKWIFYKRLSFLKDYYDNVKLERMKQEERKKQMENQGNNQEADNEILLPTIKQEIYSEQGESESQENSGLNIISVERIKEEAMSETEGEFENALIPQVEYNSEDREEEIQSLLKQYLPTIENMSNKQMRMFKTKVSELVESILDR